MTAERNNVNSSAGEQDLNDTYEVVQEEEH